MEEMPTSVNNVVLNVIDLTSDDEDTPQERNPPEKQTNLSTGVVLKNEPQLEQLMCRQASQSQELPQSTSHSFDWYLQEAKPDLQQDNKPDIQHIIQSDVLPLAQDKTQYQRQLEQDRLRQANGFVRPSLPSLSQQERVSTHQNISAREDVRSSQAVQENDRIMNRQGEQQLLRSSLRPSSSGQLIQQIQNNTDIIRTSQALIANDQTIGLRPAISSMPNQSGFLARENHQFWRAGDYDVQSTQKRTITGGMDHVRVHPKFLHSNATSHKWAFGAIAELLDNAVDEIQNGATYVKADQIFNPRDYSHALLFQDDGGGMDPECIRRCMSLGYSMKNTNTTIGQYGNGFKTSTMRLGADAIVFTRSSSGSSSTQSIGLLSYTFLRKTGQDDIIVPMVDFELPSDHEGPRMLVRSTESTWTKNLATILQWSPYASETELMKQFDDIGPHGTKIIVYNLWLNDDGILELDFDTDKEDVRLRGGLKAGLKQTTELIQSHISHRHLYSLRAYASILYLRKMPNFQIILRGKPVEYHSLADDLKFSKVIIYKPQLGVGMKEVSVATTIGFTKEAPLINVHGFNIYHKNRLIMPFWKVWQDNSSRGRGVVGVLEANFIEPAHDKQDFEKTAVLIRLESRLKQMTLDFWRENCDKIGYQGKNKSKREDPQSDLPSIQNPRPLSSVVPGLPSVVPGVSPQQISNSQGMAPLTNPVRNVQAVTSGKELQSVPGTSNKLVNNICEENIQLFMRCEQYRHRQLELNQMITRMETELKEGKRKYAQLVSNVEGQKKQRLEMLRKVQG